MAKKVKILFVDDEPNICHIFKVISEKCFLISVDTYTSPLEVLKKPNLYEYDLYIIDVLMAEMNGIELSKRLCKEHKIPILLTTGHGEIPVPRELEECVTCCLLKPYSFSSIVDKIQEVIGDIKERGET